MRRILIAECKQEVSSFNPAPSSYDDFLILPDRQLFDYHRKVRDEVGGALSILDHAPDLELIPSYGARAITSGGTLAAEFLEPLPQTGKLDGVYFSLHGAMSAANESDPEGYLLQEARRILGEHVPIVVSLDLHGILTDRMLQHADAVVVYHTYPHVDFFETGIRAANVLLRTLDGARPVTARVKIPALVRGDELITESGLIGECIRAAQAVENSPTGLSAGMLIGNPFTDVPELGTTCLVVTDSNREQAEQAALAISHTFWSHHEKMQVPLTSLDDAVHRASKIDSGTVVMMDAADATSSGASGDSNAVLAALLADGYTGRILAPIVDPAAVARAFEAGVGAMIRTTLGGALDPKRFTPLELDVRVRLLSDGDFQSESFGQHWIAGCTAVLEAGNATIVASTRPVSLYDRSFFQAQGQDPRRFAVVVVKSPHCEPHMFADWCAALINVDAPGSTSANLKSLGHTVCRRPMFPLDDDVQFTPRVDWFERDLITD